MLCAQYGNTQSYFGNIQYGFYNPPLYIWPPLDQRRRWNPPLSKQDEKQIDEQHGNAPKSPPIVSEPSKPIESNESIIMRLRRSLTMQQVGEYKPLPSYRAQVIKPKRTDDTEEEDIFILM